jgi:hypothetical protein
MNVRNSTVKDKAKALAGASGGTSEAMDKAQRLC